ncbi:MAG: tRNA threonylcarbamoyladenosine dehydratase [Oscillospiraceae bacterium]|nr:tRNA threonylcarbamoyladenosine dehydratase [Oscillospiraceae bacterium]MBQ4643958.1 tRNA threonylcarbamoyladenosine dehydratase [Oscillospiraceae bacterium]
MSRLERTELFLGKESTEKLKNARVAVIGLGGVGGAAAESLLRAGIGHLLFIDGDTVDETNINRQLLATYETVGMDKTEAARLRFEKIAPDCEMEFQKEFYLPENSAFLYDWKPDYIVDAIDTVTAKLHIAEECRKRGIKLLMCLGTGNRLDPEKLRIGDISETSGSGCPLARVIRKELKKRGIEKQTVLFSTEEAKKAALDSEGGRHSPGSISFVPPVAGYILAGKCVRDIIGEK